MMSCGAIDIDARSHREGDRMPNGTSSDHGWPALDYGAWSDTLATVQMWTQIVGKVRLSLSPWLNHGWHVPLYVNASGLGTSAIHAGGGMVQIDFDFLDHRLAIRTSTGAHRGFALEPMSVAEFYARFTRELAAAGLNIDIVLVPNEVANPIRFPDDTTHCSYDGARVQEFWRALINADRVLQRFRTSFLGKSSPVHFFWGSFDLAVTRFSGRLAPLHPGGIPGLPDAVTREAYSHEVSSAGFWPGSDQYPHAAFYSYAYPSPDGFANATIAPDAAFWSTPMGEWLLPYDAVRTAADPDATLLQFLETTFGAAASLASWDRSLECDIGVPRRPRAVRSTR
jgi:Family of unknown function (DUF5996)